MTIIFILLIPGSMPMILGYIISLVYRLIDPELVVFYYFVDLYDTTIASWPLLNQIIFYKVIVLAFVIPYIIFLRKKHPGMNFVAISKAEITHQVKKLHKPENPRTMSVEILVEQ